ncbi:MAG: flavin reductase family protein [Planctomycetes bacterium]|nr:flavin reductase family protein [Planctomycetota bacterium]
MTAKSGRPSRDEFRRACAQFATGITVVTTVAADGTPHGLTANSFTSVSADPPLVLICIDLGCSILGHFQDCEYFGINILAGHQEWISTRFATTRDERFDGVDWHAGTTGVPILGETLGWLECKVTQRLQVGDHVIVFGEVTGVEVMGGDPLLYYSSRYERLPPDDPHDCPF